MSPIKIGKWRNLTIMLPKIKMKNYSSYWASVCRSTLYNGGVEPNWKKNNTTQCIDRNGRSQYKKYLTYWFIGINSLLWVEILISVKKEQTNQHITFNNQVWSILYGLFLLEYWVLSRRENITVFRYAILLGIFSAISVDQSKSPKVSYFLGEPVS